MQCGKAAGSLFPPFRRNNLARVPFNVAFSNY